MKKILLILAGLLVVGGLTMISADADKKSVNSGGKLEKATFAGGCFWCMEPPFEKLPGVKEVISGYTGGRKVNPTYEEVASGSTGHLESVEVVYDPAVISYDKLLDVFWKNVDPTDPGGSFVDRGGQWHVTHFRDPRSLVPGSVMPPFPWIADDPAELDAMIAYIQSLGRVKDWRPDHDYEE